MKIEDLKEITALADRKQKLEEARSVFLGFEHITSVTGDVKSGTKVPFCNASGSTKHRGIQRDSASMALSGLFEDVEKVGSAVANSIRGAVLREIDAEHFAVKRRLTELGVKL